MTAPKLVTRAAFATLCGVDKSRVSHWIRDGLISGKAIVGEGRSALLDAEVAKAQLAARRDPAQALGNGAKTRVQPVATPSPVASSALPVRGSGAAKRKPIVELDEPDPVSEDVLGPDDLDPQSGDYAAQRARLARAQADAQEMKNAITRREYRPVAEFEQAWGESFVEFRSRVLALPARLRRLNAALTTSDLAAIDSELRAALTELGHAQPNP